MNVFNSLYEKQKEEAGSFATFVWLACGIYLLATSDSLSFFSWKSLLYFLPGTFVAAFLFGALSYYLNRLLAKVLSKIHPKITSTWTVVLSVIGVVIMIVECVLIYKTAAILLAA